MGFTLHSVYFTLKVSLLLGSLLGLCLGLEFMGIPNQWARYLRWDASTRSELSFQFKTNVSAGLLLYFDDGGVCDFLCLSLVDGRIQLQFSVDCAETTVVTDKQVNDSNWHFLMVSRNHLRTVLVLDGEAKPGEVRPQRQYMNIVSDLFVGGVPLDIRPAALTLDGVLGEPPFQGFILDLKYGNSEPQLLGSQGVRVEMEGLCAENPCENGGTCFLLDGEPHCDCSATGYAGKLCSEDVNHIPGLSHLMMGEQEVKVHLRSAERLRELCCANRGTFIKVGQHLGALDYLLPEEYTRTLKVLHSQAPQSTRQEIEQVIREDLGKEIKELFLSFEDTPLGAASLAQVHKAVLQDGRTVAVKIQHPKVQAQSSKDILLMEILLLVVKQIFPDFEFMWLVEEAKKNMPLELDFLNEGRNAEKVAHMFKNFDFLKVPRIYWELSTRRVLLMEFMEGGQVNDRAYMERNGIDVNEISRNLGKLYSEMIFVNGFVHCDPHPGNVLVKKCPVSGKAHIILLDHGLYQVLSESFRMDYCCLWQALIKADMKRVQKYSQRLGAGELYPLFACMLTARSWESVNRGIDRSPVSASEDVEIRSNAAAYLPQITQLLNNVPRQMLLLLKTNDLLRGIESALHTRANASSFLNMSRCCIRAVSTYRRSKSHSLYRRAQISLTEALSLWQINLYELFLWLKGSRLGSCVIALLSRMHHSAH